MKKMIIAALLVATTAVSASASAAVISLDSSLTGKNLSNKTYTPVFSGLSGLPADYTVNSLSFSFTLSDNDKGWWYGFQQRDDSKGAYSYNKKQDAFYRDVDASLTNYYATSVETAKLMFDKLVLGSDSTEGQWFEQVTEVKDGTRWDGYGCDKKQCGSKYSNMTTTYKNAYKNAGEIEIKGIISNQSIIDMLLNDGQLALTLKIGGNLMLTSANLLLDYTENEIPVEEPAEVPEPSSVLLAGAGLAAIGFARRRRSAAAKA